MATVLAAQCTDVRVNKVTPFFFKKWPSIEALSKAETTEIEEVIRSTGFFRNKAKNLKAAAEMIQKEYAGEVPKNMPDLLRLPGLGRKTANIVLSNAYNIHEGIAVDTHVARLAFRFALTESKDPKRIERDLIPLFPRQDWGNVNHFLVYFGREVCSARVPKCSNCELSDICPRMGVDKHA